MIDERVQLIEHNDGQRIADLGAREADDHCVVNLIDI